MSSGAKGARTLPRHAAERVGEVARAPVPDLSSDPGDRKIGLREQRPRPLDADVCEIGVRRETGDLFEEMGEVMLGKEHCLGKLLEAQIFARARVHELDRAPQSPVDGPRPRELYRWVASNPEVRSQEMNAKLTHERIEHDVLAGKPGRELVRQRLRETADDWIRHNVIAKDRSDAWPVPPEIREELVDQNGIDGRGHELARDQPGLVYLPRVDKRAVSRTEDDLCSADDAAQLATEHGGHGVGSVGMWSERDGVDREVPHSATRTDDDAIESRR